LGLVTGRIWTREGRVEIPHAERFVEDKESERWLSTAEAAKPVLAAAAMVTEVSDRESDIYAKWARVPEADFHILTRAWHDRPIKGRRKTVDSGARAGRRGVGRVATAGRNAPPAPRGWWRGSGRSK